MDRVMDVCTARGNSDIGYPNHYPRYEAVVLTQIPLERLRQNSVNLSVAEAVPVACSNASH